MDIKKILNKNAADILSFLISSQTCDDSVRYQFTHGSTIRECIADIKSKSSPFSRIPRDVDGMRGFTHYADDMWHVKHCVLVFDSYTEDFYFADSIEEKTMIMLPRDVIDSIAPCAHEDSRKR